jgi:hypothetical protein
MWRGSCARTFRADPSRRALLRTKKQEALATRVDFVLRQVELGHRGSLLLQPVGRKEGASPRARARSKPRSAASVRSPTSSLAQRPPLCLLLFDFHVAVTRDAPTQIAGPYKRFLSMPEPPS